MFQQVRQVRGSRKGATDILQAAQIFFVAFLRAAQLLIVQVQGETFGVEQRFVALPLLETGRGRFTRQLIEDNDAQNSRLFFLAPYLIGQRCLFDWNHQVACWLRVQSRQRRAVAEEREKVFVLHDVWLAAAPRGADQVITSRIGRANGKERVVLRGNDLYLGGIHHPLNLSCDRSGLIGRERARRAATCHRGRWYYGGFRRRRSGRHLIWHGYRRVGWGRRGRYGRWERRRTARGHTTRIERGSSAGSSFHSTDAQVQPNHHLVDSVIAQGNAATTSSEVAHHFL